MSSSTSYSSFSSCYKVYDVFPSFSGKDVRQTFISHFLKEFDLKSIKTFKDFEIESGRTLDPELKQAIMNSNIAIVVLSENYASSSYCLDELMEIMKWWKISGKTVIPIFYGLDPSHVRYQIGKFGEAFNKTCQRKTMEQIILWRQALTDVANLRGYHSHKWPSEAEMIEVIADDVLHKRDLAPPYTLVWTLEYFMVKLAREVSLGNSLISTREQKHDRKTRIQGGYVVDVCGVLRF